MFLEPAMDSLLNFVQDHKLLVSALAFVGFASVTSQLLAFLSVLAQTFILSGTKLSKFGSKRGAYAVVTGATDGIGREFAVQLAKAGFGVVLVSRSQAKLDALAEEISSKFNVPTKVHAMDFSEKELSDKYKALSQKIEGIDVGVLVNNVGRSHEMPVYFADGPEDEMNSIVNINVYGTLNITRLVLPKMIEKKNGLILNIGSFAGQVPSPMLATYSGSKAFLATWSQALAEEYKKKGIVVQLVNTFFVVSNMSKIRRASITTPTPKAFVKSALSHIGHSCGAIARPFTVTPYWSHSIADFFIGALNMPMLFITYSHNLHISIRARALKKKAKQQ